MSEKTVSAILQILEEAECLPVRERIVEIIPPNACWVDGTNCPYGFPGGRFEDRPRAFCNLNGNSCRKLEDYSKEFVELAREAAEDEIREEVENLLNDNSITASDLIIRELERIKNLRSDIFSDIDEKAIRLVANLFNDLPSGFQKYVIHEDDSHRVLNPQNQSQ